MSAKVDPATKDILAAQDKVNYHDALYADILPTLTPSEGSILRLRINLQNPSFSSFQTANANGFSMAQ